MTRADRWLGDLASILGAIAGQNIWEWRHGTWSGQGALYSSLAVFVGYALIRLIISMWKVANRRA